MLDKEQAKRRGNENVEIKDRQDAAEVIHQYINVCERWNRMCGIWREGGWFKGIVHPKTKKALPMDLKTVIRFNSLATSK